MECTYVYPGGSATPSAFLCNTDFSAISSASAVATNNALYFVWVALGIIIFLLAVQLMLWWFKQ